MSLFYESGAVMDAVEMVLRGERLHRRGAEALYHEANLFTLAQTAHRVRMRLHPEPVVTYVGDRNINYSNVCVCACRFCAFFRPPDSDEAYVLERDTMAQKIDETLRLGGTQILLQGGHHPNLPFSWYEELLQWMRETWPSLHIHAFSPPEIAYWSELYGMDTADILARLKQSGLHSLPGGGAEILHDDVRKSVSPNKCSATRWLAIMEEAHDVGLLSTATMMFGHEESVSHRLDHLFAVRDTQDRSHAKHGEESAFTAFIPWTFQPQNTRIDCPAQPAPAYLRLLAISRLVLDNIPNIQASWVTMGPQVAQLALSYGANDFGSLMIEENVVAAAGTSYHLKREDIHALIEAAGFTPKQRTMNYEIVDEARL